MNSKDNIKRILRESTNDSIDRIAVFDFDGTLMDTLEPDSGRKIYKEKTGEEWPFKGWWGRKESLDMDVFNFQPIQSVIDQYHKERSNPNTLVVMLTGRIPKLSNEVENILNHYNVKFDRYLYNYGGSTLPNKIEQMGDLLKEFPNVQTMVLLDDRDEHIPTFKQYADTLVNKGRLSDFKVHHVK
jgi:hypothetical protein